MCAFFFSQVFASFISNCVYNFNKSSLFHTHISFLCPSAKTEKYATCLDFIDWMRLFFMYACMHKCVCKRDRERKREMMLNEYQRYWAPVIWNCVSINNFDNHRVALKLYQTMLLFFFFITNKYLVVLLQHSWQRPIEREKK